MKRAELIPISEIVRRSLDEGKKPFFQVTSNSMSPLITKGDDVQISRQDENQLRVGDIVVIVDESGLLTHRLWMIFSIQGIHYVLLRGDRLNSFDPPFKASQVIGRVITRRRDNSVLDLTRGIGRLLNLGLYKFASLTNPPFPSSPDNQASNLKPIKSDGMSPSLFLRGRNRFLFVAATALTSFVDLVIRL